jgi:hypothetical protein
MEDDDDGKARILYVVIQSVDRTTYSSIYPETPFSVFLFPCHSPLLPFLLLQIPIESIPLLDLFQPQGTSHCLQLLFFLRSNVVALC